MLYLLGELGPAESTELEKDLETSSQLRDELLWQADVIAGLAGEPGTPVEVDLVNRTPVVSSLTIASWMAVAAAVLLVAVFSWTNESPNSATSPSEELLIAQAWVLQHHEHFSEEPTINSAFAAGFAESLSLSESGEGPELDSEDTLAWMFVAITASPDGTTSETSNDG